MTKNRQMNSQLACAIDVVLASIIDNKLQILLVKRNDEPFKGDWALPGGYVGLDESLDEAMVRTLKEETNVRDITYFRQLYTFGEVHRDPRGRVISTAYISLTPSENLTVIAGDDAADARWFEIRKETLSVSENSRISQLSLYNETLDIQIDYEIVDLVVEKYIQKTSSLMPSSTARLAGDHMKIINMAMDELQHHIIGTGLIFNLLPKEFTLKQVQEAYEIISGVKKDTPNFRRAITRMLIDTGHKVKVYNRAAKLYRFNPLFQYLKEDL